MWSWHIFYGIHFGFEWYEDTKIDDSKNKKHYDYFIMDFGCLRIQHCVQKENV